MTENPWITHETTVPYENTWIRVEHSTVRPGLIAETLTPVLSEVRLTNSVTDETAWSYVATGLTLDQAEPEDTEELAIKRLPMDEAIAMVLDGRINDAFTIMTMLRIHADRTTHG